MAERKNSCVPQRRPRRAVRQTRKHVFREKGILGEGAVEATRGSWVMLYVQYAGAPCEVFTVKDNNQSHRKSTHKKGGILPKSSPVRAVKPAARQPVERGQTVSCGTRGSVNQSHECLRACARSTNESTTNKLYDNFSSISMIAAWFPQR